MTQKMIPVIVAGQSLELPLSNEEYEQLINSQNQKVSLQLSYSSEGQMFTLDKVKVWQ